MIINQTKNRGYHLQSAQKRYQGIINEMKHQKINRKKLKYFFKKSVVIKILVLHLPPNSYFSFAPSYLLFDLLASISI